MIPKPGEFYLHNKTQKRYKIIGIGKHSETLEDTVIYEPQYDSEVAFWLRPLRMFTEEVELNGTKMPRFSKTT
jgi:hypothetical protein